jgi:hypothetical protein
MTPEAKVKSEIKKVLAEYGCWYFMPSMNGYGRAGIPDFIGCYQGVFFAVEAKAPEGQVTAHQQREIDAIHHAGGAAIVARSGEDARKFIHGIAIQRKA